MQKKIQENGWKIKKVIYTDTASHFWMGPQIFDVPRSYYEKNNIVLSELYDSLADDFSKRCMVSFINQRISGIYNYSENLVSDNSDEYFPKELLAETKKKLMLIDCGAFDGNDTKRFFDLYKNTGGGYLIEADEKNFLLCKDRLKDYRDRLKMFKNATGEKSGEELSFANDGNLGSGLSDSGSSKVISLSIDDLYNENKSDFINTCPILKMDIEGAELSTLKGAENFIRHTKPFLAVCLYHKKEDIIELPSYIKSINPSYRFYIRRYDKGFRDTVLYSVPF